MIILYVLLFVFIIIGVKFGKNIDYLSRNSTTAIKGIFVVIVFFSHYAGYVDLSPKIYNTLFGTINSRIGQLMVVMFLFYSGYGIFYQIRKNAGKYINAFLKHRLLPTWIQFAVCVTLFLILDTAVGTINDYSISHILLAYTGWTSIGNSNWFMFVTFALYLLVFISFKLFNKNQLTGLLCFSVLSIALTITLCFFKESWWWNTLLCFPLGMWYGYFKERIEKIVDNKYFIILISAVLILLVLWYSRRIVASEITNIVMALVFSLLIVTLSMRVSIGNKVFLFFGNHVFSIYMLQRIPLIFFRNYIENIYLYFVVSFSTTIIIAWAFDYLFSRVKGLLLNKKVKN